MQQSAPPSPRAQRIASIQAGTGGVVPEPDRTVAAQLQQSRVVHVIDGDGLIVLLGDKRVNVRLEHIDAPERGQPYGTPSRQSLIAICGGELAKVDASGKDRNGRTLARVRCNGADAGAEQVKRGRLGYSNATRLLIHRFIRSNAKPKLQSVAYGRSQRPLRPGSGEG